jgi:hypothetical protein
MKKSKVISAAFLVGTAALGLAACSTGTPKPAPTVTRTVAPPATTPPAPVVVMTASQLDTSILANGDWTSTDKTVSYKISTVQCEPITVSATGTGTGTYECTLYSTVDKSTDGYTAIGTANNFSRQFVVGPDGSWVSGSVNN